MALPVRKIRATRAKKRDQNELALRDRNGLAFRAPSSFPSMGGPGEPKSSSLGEPDLSSRFGPPVPLSEDRLGGNVVGGNLVRGSSAPRPCPHGPSTIGRCISCLRYGPMCSTYCDTRLSNARNDPEHFARGVAVSLCVLASERCRFHISSRQRPRRKLPAVPWTAPNHRPTAGPQGKPQ